MTVGAGEINFRCDVLVAYVPSVQLTHTPVHICLLPTR